MKHDLEKIIDIEHLKNTMKCIELKEFLESASLIGLLLYSSFIRVDLAHESQV
jgi:hypothetical protein